MKKISLSKGLEVLVDNKDFKGLSKFSWHSQKNKNTYYAVTKPWVKGTGKCKTIYMHRFLTEAEKGMVVDHIDGNGLNNQRDNLRVCTQTQNMMNRGKQLNNSSGYKGVVKHPLCNKWMTRIKVGSKHIYLGLYMTKEEAAQVYNDAAINYYGEYATLNSIPF
jgi:hypothetical protein